MAAQIKFQARPHSNPIKPTQFIGLPDDPDAATTLFSSFFSTESTDPVSIVDVGCGYGALLPHLSESYPNKHILGIEIRKPVRTYVENFLIAERKERGLCKNTYVYRANAMKHLCRLFHKAQLEQLYFLYPDPNLKTKHARRRILNHHLLSEYAYVLKPNGVLYFACDLQEVFNFGVAQLEQHSLFERVSSEELKGDPIFHKLNTLTADAERAVRKGSGAFKCAFRRVETVVPRF
ncbi:hypothetical protein GEMRC1_005428 [Eukaryota sp. GEM-RC1]